jgi:hypothetical protein
VLAILSAGDLGRLLRDLDRRDLGIADLDDLAAR